jgi:hypothetical protein
MQAARRQTRGARHANAVAQRAVGIARSHANPRVVWVHALLDRVPAPEARHPGVRGGSARGSGRSAGSAIERRAAGHSGATCRRAGVQACAGSGAAAGRDPAHAGASTGRRAPGASGGYASCPSGSGATSAAACPGTTAASGARAGAPAASVRDALTRTVRLAVRVARLARFAPGSELALGDFAGAARVGGHGLRRGRAGEDEQRQGGGDAIARGEESGRDSR